MLCGSLEGRDGSPLDRGELTGVQVRLHDRERLDGLGGPDDPADAPACHVEELRGRSEFECHVLRTGYLQHGRRDIAVEGDLAVGSVVQEQHIVSARERDRGFERLEIGHRGRGVGREVQPERLRAIRNRGGVQIREEPSLGRHRQRDWRAPRQPRRDPVHRIAGIGNQYVVSGIHEGHGHVRDPLLRPDQGHDLGLGIELDTEAPQVQIRHRQSQLRDAPARRVAVVARVAGGFCQLVDGDIGRRDVGVAEPQVDDVLTRATGGHLQAFDDREDVRRKRVDASKLHT